MPTNDPSTTSGVDPQGEADQFTEARERFTAATMDWPKHNARRAELIHKKHRDGLSHAERLELAKLQQLASLVVELVAPLPIAEMEVALEELTITPPTPAPTTLEQYQAVASEVDPRLVVSVGSQERFTWLWQGGTERTLASYDSENETFNGETVGEWRKGTFHDCCVYAASLLG